MKRYMAIVGIVLVLFGFMQHWTNKNVQAQMMIALAAYTQAPTHPGRPLRPSPGEPTLLKGEIKIFTLDLAELNADIIWAQGLPDGRIIRTDIGTVEQRDDWIIKAQAEVLVLEALIAELVSYQ